MNARLLIKLFLEVLPTFFKKLKRSKNDKGEESVLGGATHQGRFLKPHPKHFLSRSSYSQTGQQNLIPPMLRDPLYEKPRDKQGHL